MYDLCIAMYSFNQIFLIYHGKRELTSTDFSKLSVLQRLRRKEVSVLQRVSIQRNQQKAVGTYQKCLVGVSVLQGCPLRES